MTDGRTGLLDVQRPGEEEQVASYRERLVYLTRDQRARYTMGRAAFSEAQRRTWPEAMQCLVRGYSEVTESARTLVAV